MPAPKWKRNPFAKLAEVVLRLANIIDRNAEKGNTQIAEQTGCGYLTIGPNPAHHTRFRKNFVNI